MVRQHSRRDNCPLCDSATRETVHDFGGICAVRCQACGFGYADRIFHEQDLRSYYESGYGGIRHRQGQEVNAMVNLAMLEHTIGSVRGSALDVGSGYGLFLARLRARHGTAVLGVEFSRDERAFAQDTLKVHTLADLSGLEAGRQFDFVSAFEVIEHVAQPRQFVEQLWRHVRPGGYLIIGTDNFRCRVVEAMGAGFPKWIPHQHISHFDHVTLPALVSKLPGVLLHAVRSYTPWELRLRRIINVLSAGRIGMYRYRMEAEFASEDSRPFRFFGFRRAFNRIWVSLTRSRDLKGEMMFVSVRKTA